MIDEYNRRYGDVSLMIDRLPYSPEMHGGDFIAARALGTHSDEVMRHPSYLEFIWKTKNPEHIAMLIDAGYDYNFVKGHYSDSRGLEIYMNKCIEHGLDLEGEMYTPYYNTHFLDDGADIISFLFKIKEVFNSLDVVNYLCNDVNTLRELYTRYIKYEYDRNVEYREIRMLIICDAFFRRGIEPNTCPGFTTSKISRMNDDEFYNTVRDIVCAVDIEYYLHYGDSGATDESLPLDFIGEVLFR